MKKLFLILMMCLLPYQFAWAMVASYDTHGAHDTEVHFGHHEHYYYQDYADLSESGSELNPDHSNTRDAKNLETHLHLGFFHLSCGELISYVLPVFEQQATQAITPYLFAYHSPPTYQPERPNWLSAV